MSFGAHLLRQRTASEFPDP